MVLTELASTSVPIGAAWLRQSSSGLWRKREEPSLHPESGHDEFNGFLSLHLLCEQNCSP